MYVQKAGTVFFLGECCNKRTELSIYGCACVLQALANVSIGSLICNVGAGGPPPPAGAAPAGGPAPSTAAAPGTKLGVGGRSGDS